MAQNPTLYRELLWIARRAGLKDGWAYYMYKDITGDKPNSSGKQSPIMPPEALLYDVKPHMNKFAFSKVCNMYANKMLTAEQKKIKSDAWRVLDANRPKLEDM